MKKFILSVIILLSIIISASSYAETNQFKCGAKKTKIIKHLKINKTSANKAKTTIDHSSDIIAPQDQGSQSSCTGFAISYAKQYYEDTSWNSSNLNKSQFSPSYIYNQINGGVDEGSYISDGLSLTVSQGIAPYTYMNYNESDFTTQPNTNAMSSSKYFKNSSYTYGYITSTDLSAFKTYLNSNTAVAEIAVYQDFMDLNSTTNQVYDSIAGSLLGCHAIAIVGYDDTKSAFKVINSWGTDWGNNGYGWISYNLFTSNQNFLIYKFSDVNNSHSNYKCYVNNVEMTGDTEPAMLNSHFMVPVKAFSDLLPSTTTWNSQLEEATVTKVNDVVKLRKNYTTAYKNQSPFTLSEAPYISSTSRLMVPVTYVNQCWQWNVNYVDLAKTCDIIN